MKKILSILSAFAIMISNLSFTAFAEEARKPKRTGIIMLPFQMKLSLPNLNPANPVSDLTNEKLNFMKIIMEVLLKLPTQD